MPTAQAGQQSGLLVQYLMQLSEHPMLAVGLLCRLCSPGYLEELALDRRWHASLGRLQEY